MVAYFTSSLVGFFRTRRYCSEFIVFEILSDKNLCVSNKYQKLQIDIKLQTYIDENEIGPDLSQNHKNNAIMYYIVLVIFKERKVT